MAWLWLSGTSSQKSHDQVVNFGLAYLGLAWLGSWPEARPCTSLNMSKGTLQLYLIVTVKVNNSAMIWSGDSSGDSLGESGSDLESTESTRESIHSILDCRSSCWMYVIT